MSVVVVVVAAVAVAAVFHLFWSGKESTARVKERNVSRTTYFGSQCLFPLQGEVV